MSTNSVFKWLAVAFLLSVLSGCITTEVKITLNPDGSGTLEYTRDFDRAPDEMREKIKEHFSNPRLVKDIAKEKILEHYPEPHFELTTYEDDPEQLTTRIVIQFKDINALLVERETADLGLSSLDFSVDSSALVFSVKEDEDSRQWPEQYDVCPGQETITIVNANSGEEITFSRELSSKTERTGWTGRLRFPRRLFFFGGHRIVRTPGIQLFHGYPVTQMAGCEIKTAEWNIRNHKTWSSLNLKLNVSLPEGNHSYTRWENPVVLSGGFLPEQPNRMKLKGGGEFKQEASEIELKLPVPTEPVETLDSLQVRIKATRSTGTKIVNLGPIKPNTEYTTGDLIIKTDNDLNDNRLGFKATGASDRLKTTWIETARGNRFKLKKSSWSGTTQKNINYWEFLPLEGCSLCVELFDTIEPCYIDLNIPTLDLTQRAWKIDEETTEQAESTGEWKAALKTERPELFSISVPPVEKEMFENKDLYKAYFQGLEDQQLLPAIVGVIDYMVHHKPKRGEDWIQNYAQQELRKRTAYLKANRQTIAEQLFGIYKHTPGKAAYIAVFFTNLNLQEFSQPRALEEIKTGNLRFLNRNLFGESLTEEDIRLLNSTLLNSDDWVQQMEVLYALNNAEGISLAFAMQLFNDPSLSTHVRTYALGAALQHDEVDPNLAEHVVLNTTDLFPRNKALKFLAEQDPFPVKIFSTCLRDIEISRRAAGELASRLSSVLHSNKGKIDALQQWQKTIAPLTPILKDLAEQLKEYDAKNAVEALEKIRKLDAAAQPEQGSAN